MSTEPGVILHAAIPLLALAVLGTARTQSAPWPMRPLRAVALVALAAAGAVFLALRAEPLSPPLEPFSLALMCVLVGWLVLEESSEATGETDGEPSVVPPLAGAAAAIVVGAGAAMLAALSRAPAAWLGLLERSFWPPTVYVLCALGGLFVRYALADATLLYRLVAACAWFAVARSLATPDGLSVWAMLLLFLLPASTGFPWRRKPGPTAVQGGQ